MLNKLNVIHFEKLCLLKPHYHATKVRKMICIQLLCKYPLGSTTIVQVSFTDYNYCAIIPLEIQGINK